MGMGSLTSSSLDSTLTISNSNTFPFKRLFFQPFTVGYFETPAIPKFLLFPTSGFNHWTNSLHDTEKT